MDEVMVFAGRERRLAWIVDRLNRNLRPMQRQEVVPHG